MKDNECIELGGLSGTGARPVFFLLSLQQTEQIKGKNKITKTVIKKNKKKKRYTATVVQTRDGSISGGAVKWCSIIS